MILKIKVNSKATESNLIYLKNPSNYAIDNVSTK